MFMTFQVFTCRAFVHATTPGLIHDAAFAASPALRPDVTLILRYNATKVRALSRAQRTPRRRKDALPRDPMARYAPEPRASTAMLI